jgi:hypothetical protein
MNRMLWVGAVLAVSVVGPAARAQQPEASAQARQATEAWLAEVDSGRYADSWDKAAEAFRSALSRTAWDSTMRALRGPLGAVTSRELLGAQPVTDPPGAPPGEYVLLQFRTQFAGRELPAVETVVPMKDKDGVWRVSGYFIR